ncbi:MAG: RNB domain-containing ribonuclease [Treponema sp.]|jgi:exoribonuclease-2|nr:RNB domain-containing ribonuclease [Treponema sp.]
MFREKCLVAYKAKPAVVTAIGDKIDISVLGGEKLRVREKDIELIHPGPLDASAGALAGAAEPLDGEIRDAWELLGAGADPAARLTLKELAELVYGGYSPQTAWAAYGLLREGVYFAGSPGAISPCGAAAVEAAEQRRDGKLRDAREREGFLLRIRANAPILPKPEDSPDYQAAGRYSDSPGGGATDLRFLQDVEALAFGRSGKSRTLKDLGRPETPEEAHRLLLSWGVWTPWVNPHPSRFGVSAVSAQEAVPPPPAESRADLASLRSYAIDNAYSADPDDAVSVEGPDSEGRYTLYVHVADPAASALPGSPADLEARGRGATLYLPEGPARMLAEDVLSRFALSPVGALSPLPVRERPAGVFPALSFRLSLFPGGVPENIEVFPSLVKVTRLSYEEADRIVSGRVASGDDPAAASDLVALAGLGEANTARRVKAGAVMIDLPEAHIAVDIPERRITVEPNAPSAAAAMVRECMLLAGEAAARWASSRSLPFPYVCQEAGDLPGSPLPGPAGSWQLRRCMRARTLSAKPGPHAGLGLEKYTQVTSPLRRYTDLLTHQQIRAALGSGAYVGRPPLSEDEILPALAAGEAASTAVVHAERASRGHWLAVYLSGMKDSQWEAVVLEKRGGFAAVIIPALGLETQIPLRDGMELNDLARISLVSVRIPQALAVFA